MKKIISIILIIVMATAMTVPAFALSSGTTPQTQECSDAQGVPAIVEYGVSNGFELLIPAAIGFDDTTIGADKFVSFTVAAIKVILSKGQKLELKISSQSENEEKQWLLKVPDNETSQSDGSVNNEPIVYTIAMTKGGAALVNGNTVLTVPCLALSGYQVLHANTFGSNQSGIYVDNLTFLAQIVSA